MERDKRERGRRHGASTGPRSIERGMENDLFRAFVNLSVLQRGRAQLSAECTPQAIIALAADLLQRGRAQLSAE